MSAFYATLCSFSRHALLMVSVDGNRACHTADICNMTRRLSMMSQGLNRPWDLDAPKVCRQGKEPVLCLQAPFGPPRGGLTMR